MPAPERPPDLDALLAWLAAARVPDGLAVGRHLVVVDGQKWRLYYLAALGRAKGYDLAAHCGNVRAVRAAVERQEGGCG